jgi:hypothetical protein
MIWLYAVQFAAPLPLICWLLWAPARRGVGFFVQVLASAATLAALALQGIWLLPPWWAPFVFAVLLALAAWLGWRSIRPFPSAVPVTWGAWIVLVFFIAPGATSTWGTAEALQSRTRPEIGLVNLAFPLGPGHYLVVNGGSNSSTNAHLETLDAGVPRYRAWRGQSYGVDLVALDEIGLRARGVQPADPHAYVIYGVRVLAPCAGEVVIAVDGLPDMQVPDVESDHLAGRSSRSITSTTKRAR